LDAVAAQSDPALTGQSEVRRRIVIGRWWRSSEAAQRYLVILLLLFLVKQVFNVIVFPPFSGHDEVAHYAYLRTVATDHRVPVIPDLAEWRKAWTSRSDLPGDLLPKDIYRYCAYVLDWNYCEDEKWKNNPPVAVTYAGQFYPHGWNYASNHPPLYYVVMTPVYLATDFGTPAQQQYVLRTATIPIGMAIVLLTFLIARLLFPRDSLIPTVAATFVAFQTQLSYESAMINNDILLVAFFTLALYILVRGMRQGFTLGSAAALGLVVGLGLLTKASMITILPIVAIVLVFSVGYRNIRRWVTLGAITGLVIGLVVWPWYLYLHRTYGNFSALPQVKDLQFLWTYRNKPSPTILQQLWNRNFAADRWSETWGDFGWRLIQLPQWLLTVIGLPFLVMVIASLTGLIWATIQLVRRRSMPGYLKIDALQCSGLWLMLLVCVLAYGAMLQFGTTFSLTQARYYFNAVPAAAILIAFGLRALTPDRARPGVAAGFLVFMIAINVLIYSQGVLPFWYLPT
jgi:4-amino-4-deoxy-L-arabinose transferase-like glycosyltransferase